MGNVEEKRKKKDYEIEGWDLLMSHYASFSQKIEPALSSFKEGVMQNVFVRNVIIAIYTLMTYESSFLSILMFVSATIMGNFWGVEWYTIHLFDMFTDIS